MTSYRPLGHQSRIRKGFLLKLVKYLASAIVVGAFLALLHRIAENEFEDATKNNAHRSGHTRIDTAEPKFTHHHKKHTHVSHYSTNVDKKSLDKDKLNILIVFGTRPEIIKIAPIIWEYEKHKDTKYSNISIYCLFTNQHQDLVNDGIMSAFKLENYVNFELFLNQSNDNSHAENDQDEEDKLDRLSFITTKILRGFSAILHDFDHFFNLLLVQGDTTSAMAAALSVYYHSDQNIYLGHIEAGLRTFNPISPYPEEINREFITKMANIHFAPTFYSRINVLKESISPFDIILSGNTVIDAIQHIHADPKFKKQFDELVCSDSLSKHLAPLKLFCNKQINVDNSQSSECSSMQFGLFTMHRREKKSLSIGGSSSSGSVVDNILTAVLEILNQHPQLHLFYPVHPSQTTVVDWLSANQEYNSDVKQRFHLIEPLSPMLMPFIYKQLSIIITDSGGIQEEITAFNDAINNKYVSILITRDTTERVEILESKQGKLVAYDTKQIVTSANQILKIDAATSDRSCMKNDDNGSNMTQPILNDYFPFGHGNSSSIILKSIVERFDIIKHYSFLSNQERSKYVKIGDFHDKIRETHGIQNKSHELTGNLLMILTVFQRDNIRLQLDHVFSSSVIPEYIVIFQNENHRTIDISSLIKEYSYKFPEKYKQNIKGLYHIHSINFNTKYFGRFLIPLFFNTDYWMVLDDDIMVAQNCIENHLRVVKSYNALATANGRIFANTKNFDQIAVGDDADNNRDFQVDFGGHIWTGKSEWIRDAFSFETPPYTVETAEDMMLSAALQLHYGIQTIVPKACRKEKQFATNYKPGDQFASYINKRKQNNILRPATARYWVEQRGWQLIRQNPDVLIPIDQPDSSCGYFDASYHKIL